MGARRLRRLGRGVQGLARGTIGVFVVVGELGDPIKGDGEKYGKSGQCVLFIYSFLFLLLLFWGVGVLSKGYSDYLGFRAEKKLEEAAIEARRKREKRLQVADVKGQTNITEYSE